MKFVTLLLLVCFAMTLNAEIVLVDNGKSPYTLVLSDSASKAEREAAADFAETLEKISGAKLQQGNASDYRIFIGQKAPSDRKKLEDGERRIKSEGNDIYIYGEGRDGTVFAIYDFLDRFLGCRWYSIWDMGWERITNKKNISFAKLDFSLKPSFDSLDMYCGTSSVPPKMLKIFQNHNRFYVAEAKLPRIGPGGHVPGQLIPPGEKYKAHDHKFWTPYKYSKKDAYFGTHPEYFSMNKKGKRVPDKQLCYSNPGLRRLFTEKLEEIISKEHKGGKAQLICGLNDNPGFDGETLCYCDKCMELVKKYDSSAGPYWDYLIELGNLFRKKHPQIVLSTSAYLATEKVPRVDKMPDNVIISLAPLNKNFLKPYDHPTNKKVVNRLKAWGKVTSNLWVQLYPTVYPRCSTARPLLANIHQEAQNIRVSKKLNVRALRAEIGYRVYDMTGFNPLRIWLMAQLANDVSRDEKELVEGFITDVYGKAAPMMLEYYRELEDLEAKEPGGLNWSGVSYGSFSYLTAENFVRWNRGFDEMEKLTADDPKRLRAVQLARVDLDEAILSIFPRLPKDCGLNFEQTLNRARKTIKDQTSYIQSQQRLNQHRVWKKWTDYKSRVPNGVDFFAACANTPKPLRAPLEKIDPAKVLRMVPLRTLSSGNSAKQHLLPDEQAAFGWALPGKKKLKKENKVFQICHYKPDGSRYWILLNGQKKILLSDLKKHPNEYRLYYVGYSRLFPQSGLYLYRIAQKGVVWLGHLYNAKRPNMFYDFYISAKYVPGDEIWIDELIMVERGESKEKQYTINGVDAG